jgi:hypothetical protein
VEKVQTNAKLFPGVLNRETKEGGTAMPMWRKILILILSAAMVLAGAYLLILQLLISDIIYFKIVIGAAALITLGAYLLWVDIIAPIFGIKK